MNADELLSIKADKKLNVVEGVDPSTAELINGNIFSVSDLCAVPIYMLSNALSNELSKEQDIELKNEVGETFATICFDFDRRTIENPDLLTKWQYVAFLANCKADDNLSVRDYVIVDQGHLKKYLSDYKNGAPIWGGFSHEKPELPSQEQSDTCLHRKQSVTSINAYSGLVVPTNYHREAFHRYLKANNNFDRFLHLYHSLELLFDYVIFKKVQSLSNDLVGFGEIMKENSRKELDRLNSILNEYCLNSDEIGTFINKASCYEATCREIFQDHSKDADPLKKNNQFDTFWNLVASSGVSAENLKSKNLANDSDKYQLLIKNVASYWIYRIRCSIAHKRVGEFIFTADHDKFVGDFGVSLLRCVVQQVLSNPEFKNLLTLENTLEPSPKP